MAVFQAVNVLSGSPELPKYIDSGDATEIWRVSLPSTLANGDTILGPSMPYQGFMSGVTVDVTDLDASNGITFTVGYAGFPAAFISTSTIAQTGGITGANVAGTLGFNQFAAGINTQVIVTITHAANSPVAGTMFISIDYTANP